MHSDIPEKGVNYKLIYTQLNQVTHTEKCLLYYRELFQVEKEMQIIPHLILPKFMTIIVILSPIIDEKLMRKA